MLDGTDRRIERWDRLYIELSKVWQTKFAVQIGLESSAYVEKIAEVIR